MPTIYLAAGCFWGVQAVFNQLEDVLETKSGYCAGHKEFPSYEEVCKKTTGHTEAVKVVFNAEKISINKILDLFFFIHNPEQIDGQGNDIGPQYRSGIYINPDSKIFENQIQSYIENLKQKRPGLTTEYKIIDQFFDAEEYHQNYLNKNPFGYCHINMISVNTFLKDSKYNIKT